MTNGWVAMKDNNTAKQVGWLLVLCIEYFYDVKM